MKHLNLDYQKYRGLVAKICRDLAQSDWRPDYIIGITRGGLLPAVMISHYFNVPCHSLKISLRDGNADDCETNCWMADDAYEGKNILIVDDINDSGATLNWLIRDWQQSAYPYEFDRWEQVWGGNVKFAVVVDNLASQCSHGMDFVGMEVNKAEEEVWIDFPYENWWCEITEGV